MQIVAMVIAHYDAVLDLMRQTSGVTIREADSREAMERYLLRNPGLSAVAEEGGRVIGCALCGHDGRRGYLHHVIVAPAFRGQGIAQHLVDHCLDGLAAIGIVKTHIEVFRSNESANRYWTQRGWQRRDDIYRYSFNRSTSDNA